MISPKTKDRWRHEVDFLLDDGWTECSEWELDFLDSMSVLVEQEKDLTFKQSSKLHSIFERVQEKLG